MSSMDWHYRLTKKIHKLIIDGLVKVTTFAVAKANYILFSVPILSLGICALGFSTNFNMETDKISLWTPYGSSVLGNGKWIKEESGFPNGSYPIHVTLHADGENVLTVEAVDIIFQALEIFEFTDGYNSVCKPIILNTTLASSNSTQQCHIKGITNIFNDSYEGFATTIATDDDLIEKLSEDSRRRNEKLARHYEYFGYPEEKHVPGMGNAVVRAELLKVRLGIPRSEAEGPFEELAISRLLDFRQTLQKSTNPLYHLDVLSMRSYDRETEEAVREDLPLLPITVSIMCIFSSLVYFKRDGVNSSCLCLGMGAVASVTFSILTSFGIMFLLGVPFTILVVAVPFVVLGIGLDGSFYRTDSALSVAVRIKQTIEDCGTSIVLTTATTTAALVLGMVTKVPAIRSFYLYAAPCIVIDFLYQVTFFVALIVVNEKRKNCSRYDCLPCMIRSPQNLSEGNNENMTQNAGPCTWILMRYHRLIERSIGFNVVICLLFISWTISSLFFCSKLKVSFDFTDLLSSQSYVRSFIRAIDEHSDPEVYKCTVFFRDLDFALPSTHSSMNAFVEDLVAVTGQPPEYFWLRDFEHFIHQGNRSIDYLSFEEQLDMFLTQDLFQNLYSKAIVRDNNNEKMTASAVALSLGHIGINNVRQQTAFLSQQLALSQQSANAFAEEESSVSITEETSVDRLPFFTFSEDYYMWAFYSIAVDELVMTTIFSLVAVLVIAFLFIPNMYACLVVTFSIAMIYVDVLGIIYLAGLSINPVTLLAIIMSIGLLVDYILHIVLRCFEPNESVSDEDAEISAGVKCRYKGVKECLETMGSSVFIGGFSTILSTIPLLFSTSTLFGSICIIFLSFVTVSLFHGLVFVPAFLSIFMRHDNNDGRSISVESSKNAEDTLVVRDRNDTGESWDLDEKVPAVETVCSNQMIEILF